jgi:predicted nucleotidyltransferase
VIQPDDEQLAQLVEVLQAHRVSFVVFGSYAGRLQGADLQTVDIDVVPERSPDNLQRLCDALNSLSPRWRVDDVSPGLRIDGGRLEPRHILGSSIAIGLVTSAGLVDIVLEPKGFERGYSDLLRSAAAIEIRGTTVPVGSVRDLIRSKELLGREKDQEHLPELRARQAELTREHWKSHNPSDDRGPGLGF